MSSTAKPFRFSVKPWRFLSGAIAAAAFVMALSGHPGIAASALAASPAPSQSGDGDKAAYDDIIARFGTATDLSSREKVAASLMAKAAALGN